jgi:ribonuclease Z
MRSGELSTGVAGLQQAMTSRRSVLAGGAGLAAFAFSSEAAAQTNPATIPAPPPNGIAVTLLGTGTPALRPDRWGPSTLVNGKLLVFDTGRGCAVRLDQIGVRLTDLHTVFLTHFHADHVNGLADLWLMRFLFANRFKVDSPLRLSGPMGTSELAENLEKAFSADIRIRHADENAPLAAARFKVQEFEQDGVIMDEDGVKVTAFAVSHGPLIKPAFGYRIDYAGRSVTISGDTKFDENLIRHATGTDLLIHSVGAASERQRHVPFVRTILSHHISPEEAGTVFSRAKPRLAAYTHFVLMAADPVLTPTMADIERWTRTTYDGPLVLGEDLTRFIIGEDVKTYRWDEASRRYRT